MLKKQVKKISLLLVSTLSICTLLIAPVRAATSGFVPQPNYLQLIWQNTSTILNRVNNLPNYLNALTALALGWLSPDTSDATANLQQNFTNLANAVSQDQSTQLGLQPRLLGDFFGSNATTSTLPYANDLTFQTLLNQPYFNPDPRNSLTNKVDSAYNYIKNASGMSISHVIPGNNWNGKPADQTKYINYYNTISAVQTFNMYVMSKLYASYSSNNAVDSLQNTLMQQASSSDWFTQAASENIGVVLRQILIYDSQIYVMLNQMLQTQREMLAAQTMSNTLVILGNQFTESNLLGKATGNPQP